MASTLRFVGLTRSERPSARAYARALRAIGDRLRGDVLRALHHHAHAKDATASPVQISKWAKWKYNEENQIRFRHSYGTLGRWLADELRITEKIGRFLDQGRAVKTYALAESAFEGGLRWRLYPEFVEALRRVGILDNDQTRRIQKRARKPGSGEIFQPGQEPRGKEFSAHYKGERTYRSAMMRALAMGEQSFQCQVCDLRFVDRYGELGENYIEAHHVLPTSQQKDKTWWVTPEHLKALCSNCHRMVHRLLKQYPVKSISEGRKRVEELRRRVQKHEARVRRRHAS